MPEWERVPLGEVLTSVPASRRETVQADKEYRLLGVRLNNEGAFLRETKKGSESSAPSLYRVEAGDFIYSRLFAWRGAFGLIPPELDGCYVSNEFPLFRAKDDRLDLEWLDFWFHLQEVIRTVEADCTGSTPLTRNRYKETFFLALEIPLPPLPEQQRIVARVKGLLDKVEEATRLRGEVKNLFHLLENSRINEVFQSFSDGPITSVKEVCDVRGGIQKSSARTAGANPRRYLTVAHVQRNEILTSDPRYFEVTEDELEKWRLESGDVLVIEGNGSSEQIGRSAVFNGEIADCVHQNHVIRIRGSEKKLLPEFLNAYLNSPTGREQMLEISRTTSGLYNLSVGRVKEIRLPLPSLEQQEEAVQFLRKISASSTEVYSLQEKATTELQALPASILAQAFAGAL